MQDKRLLDTIRGGITGGCIIIPGFYEILFLWNVL